MDWDGDYPMKKVILKFHTPAVYQVCYIYCDVSDLNLGIVILTNTENGGGGLLRLFQIPLQIIISAWTILAGQIKWLTG
jgi:hypothetical protein